MVRSKYIGPLEQNIFSSYYMNTQTDQTINESMMIKISMGIGYTDVLKNEYLHELLNKLNK